MSAARRSTGRGRRVLLWVAAAAIAYFAVEGGEYGTVALIKQRLEARHARRAIDSLQRDVDSLSRLKRAVLTDPAIQERIAREEFGMVKQKELLYRFTPADTSKPAKRP